MMPRKNDLLVWSSDWSGNKTLCRFVYCPNEGVYNAPDMTRRNLREWETPEVWAARSGGAKKDFTFILTKEYST